MPRLTQADLIPLNQTFDDRSPDELLRWARQIFGERLAVLSAMQMAGSMICHLVATLKLEIPVVFVDTGVNFQETLETRDRLGREYQLNIITLHPDHSMEQQTRELGVLYLTPEGQKQCCDLRKTQPLLKVKGQFDAFVGGLRRADGGRRDRCPILSVDPGMNCVRINPLANVSDEAMHDYVDRHRVIVNPLHAQGFTTVGCNRCTTPVLSNEPKRAGRWRHLGPWSVYCGINPSDVDSLSQMAVDLPQDLIDRIHGRETDFTI